MRDAPRCEDPELLAALDGAALPLQFADPSEGGVVGRCSGKEFVAHPPRMTVVRLGGKRVERLSPDILGTGYQPFVD